MEILNDLELADIYLEARSLPRACLPAHVYRDDDITIVFMDPAASRLDLALWTQMNLTVAEGNALRTAWGQPARGEGPMSDFMLDGPCGHYVPETLRLPTPAEVAQATQELAQETRENAARVRDMVRFERVVRQATHADG